jgi:hypothetical protein
MQVSIKHDPNSAPGTQIMMNSPSYPISFYLHLIVKNTIGDHGRNLIASFFKNNNTCVVQKAVDMDAIDLL